MDVKEANRQKFSKNYKIKGNSLVYKHDTTIGRSYCCEYCSNYPDQSRKGELQEMRKVLNKKLKKCQRFDDINF